MAYSSTTNVGLRKPIDESILMADIENIQADLNSNMDLLESVLAGSATVTGTNPSIVSTSGKRFVYLYACSAGSISTITGMLTNVPFTLIMNSSGASLSLLDASPKLLASAWTPSTVGGNITLVWDGTNYIEVARVAP